MLASKIFSDTPRSFFAMLARPTGELYVDALDAIEEAQRRRQEGGLTRGELSDICQRVLDAHAATSEVDREVFEEDQEFDISGDESGSELEEAVGRSPKITAAAMIREMLAIEWLEEPRRNDYQRRFYLDSRAELMLDSLRRIAYPEQVAFTDKLHLVCSRLSDPEAFTLHPLSDLESCLDNARFGLQELRALQQGVARLTLRQLKSESLKENLRVLYDDFAENIGQRCYRQLVSLKLPIRLPLAKEALGRIESDSVVRDKMLLALSERRPDLTGAEVEEHLRSQFQELFELLEAVEPQAEAVDRRAADFARRSFARFRYLQEVSSGRREEMREFFEAVNEQYEGERISDLEGKLRIPDLRHPEVGVLSGLESLAFPGKKRERFGPTAIEDWNDAAWEEEALSEMGENINNSLNALRATRFFESIEMPEDDEALSSQELVPNDDKPEEWIIDLVALLLHAEVNEVEYRIFSPREDGVIPRQDEKVGYLIDRFQISRR